MDGLQSIKKESPVEASLDSLQNNLFLEDARQTQALLQKTTQNLQTILQEVQEIKRILIEEMETSYEEDI